MAHKHAMQQKLTEKHRLFLNHYAETGKRKESAIKAGYPERDAEKRASQILKKPNIKKYMGKIVKNHNLELNKQMDNEIGIPFDHLLNKLDQIIEAGTTQDKLDNLATPSHALQAIAEQSKLMGLYAPEKNVNVNIDLEMNKAYELTQAIKEKEKERDY
jgi:phage terminase small subunit